MVKVSEPVTAFNRNAADTALKLAALSMDNAEKLVRLQLETVREALEESLRSAQALAQVKDPQQYAEQRAKSLEHNLDRLMAYSGKVYDLAAATQAEFGRLMETRLAAISREMAQMVDEAAKTAPPGSAPALDAIKQTLAATNTMVDTMAKTAKQFAQAADTGIKSAARTVKPGAKKRG